MNMLFFEAATALYLLSAAGYLLYIVKPDVKRTAGIASGRQWRASLSMQSILLPDGRSPAGSR